MNVLGIETSCDETAAAIVNGEGRILASLVLSQLKEHEAFGGVVPEIAARAHLEHLDTLIKAAMQDAGLDFSDLHAVAATCGPGLIGGLMVGMMAGKAIAAARDIPFIAVNHLEGHALTPRLSDNIEFPYLLLLVSGGHTQILVAEDVGSYKRWGTTLDDAAGECFDKSAKIIGLPYPGGPNLEKAANLCKDPQGARERFPLPTPMKGRKDCDFSFSGLKTAVRIHADRLADPHDNTIALDDATALASAFQQAMAETIADRCKHAVHRFLGAYGHLTSAPALVVAGGVSANAAIRQALDTLCQHNGMKLYAPPLQLCGDNAAMIAWTGVERLRKGMIDTLDFKAKPRWPLDPAAEPRHGAGVKA